MRKKHSSNTPNSNRMSSCMSCYMNQYDCGYSVHRVKIENLIKLKNPYVS